jgi:hypothetical protein
MQVPLWVVNLAQPAFNPAYPFQYLLLDSRNGSHFAVQFIDSE